MDAWLALRWSLRACLKRPAQTVAVVAILACAIAAATVLGALFAAVIHDPPPITTPSTVGRVWLADDTMPAGHRPASMTDFDAWRTATRTLTDLTAFTDGGSLLGDLEGVPVAALSVTPAYFQLTGRMPVVGRAFSADDTRDGAVVIVSDRLWRERFNGGADIIGRRVTLDATPRTIVGVMPAGFWFPFRNADVWLPLAADARASVDIAGRLRPGRSWSDVQAEFDVLVRSRTLVRSLQQEALIRLGTGLTGLVAPAVVILLIACANVGNLLLMRLFDREREFAIRAALGASAFQLARLSLAESALLGGVAGVIGAVLALWGTRMLQLAAAAVPAFGAVRSDPLIVTLAGVATAVTVVVVAPLPAIRLARWKIQEQLAGGLRRPMFRRFHYGVGDVLIVLQVALAVVMVVVSAFNLRLFAEATRISRPADADRVRVAQVRAGRTVAADARPVLFGRLVDELRDARGAEAVALATGLPEFGQPRVAVTAAEGDRQTSCRVKVAHVSEEFFRALGLRFLSGRIGPRPAAIVSESAALRCLSDRSGGEVQIRVPVGLASTDRWFPVTGTVVDPFSSRMPGTDAMAASVWIVRAREWPARVLVIVRDKEDHSRAPSPTAAAVKPIDGLAMGTLAPVEDRIGPGSAAARLILGVLGSVSLLALLLAFTGVYAAMSQSCARRLPELGIRLALGASPGGLVVAALVHDVPLLGAGVVTGIVGTVWVTAIVWRDLLVFNAVDLRVWSAVFVAIATASLCASVPPALRAIRVDPIAVLRAE